VPKKATEFIQFKLRIREGLRRQIEREAKKNGRSVNSEAVARLEQSFAQQETADLIKDTARATALDTFHLLLKSDQVEWNALFKQLRGSPETVTGTKAENEGESEWPQS
jgi:hypothetical protein